MGTRRLKRYEYYSEEELAALPPEDRAIVMQDARQRGLVDAQGNKIKKPKDTSTEQAAGNVAGTVGGTYVGYELAGSGGAAATTGASGAAASGTAAAGGTAASGGAAAGAGGATTTGAGGGAATAGTLGAAAGIGAFVAGAAYGGYMGYGRQKSHKDYNRDEEVYLQSKGINTFQTPFYNDAKEAYRSDLPSDYVGYDKDGKWVNNKFLNSREEVDLEPEDIMNAPSFSRLYGNSWVQASPETRRQIAEEALRRGLVTEQKLLHYRVIDDQGLNDFARQKGVDANQGLQGAERRYQEYDQFGNTRYMGRQQWVENPDGTRNRVVSDGTGEGKSRMSSEYRQQEQDFNQKTDEELERFKRQNAERRASARGEANPYETPTAPTSTANQAPPAPVAGTGSAAAPSPGSQQTGSLVQGPNQTAAQQQQIAAAGVKSAQDENVPEEGYITVETGPSPQLRSAALGSLQSGAGNRPQSTPASPTFQNALLNEESPIQVATDIAPEGETDRERFGSIGKVGRAGSTNRFGTLANPLVYN